MVVILSALHPLGKSLLSRSLALPTLAIGVHAGQHLGAVPLVTLARPLGGLGFPLGFTLVDR
jgi:hypothetical protein